MINNGKNEECHEAKLVISSISTLKTEHTSSDSEYYSNL